MIKAFKKSYFMSNIVDLICASIFGGPKYSKSNDFSLIWPLSKFCRLVTDISIIFFGKMMFLVNNNWLWHERWDRANSTPYDPVGPTINICDLPRLTVCLFTKWVSQIFQSIWWSSTIAFKFRTQLILWRVFDNLKFFFRKSRHFISSSIDVVIFCSVMLKI